ncbi:MAG: YjjG family noncanonical pyrimidine nucleotidase [Oscillospiraceae bacterium]|nr:YjjG family noncanonical pyrimidine nucleotidase [Oscillospiraceae bacterium]
MANYNCLLLDLDGTFWDFDAAELKAIQATLQQFELPCTEDVIARYKEINKALWLALEKGEVKKEKLVVMRFSRLLAALGEKREAAKMNDFYLTALSKQGDIYPGADETVIELANVATVAAVTNGVERVQMGRLKATGFTDLIDAIYVSEKIGVAKPSRKFFDYALQDLGVTNRKKVLVVGDSLNADILGGINAGLDTCWVNLTQQENNLNIKPTYVVYGYEELKHLIIGEEKKPDVYVKKERFV